MDTQVVYLGHFDFLCLSERENWDASDASDELFALVPHADEPFGLVPGRGKSPAEEFLGIVEPEGVVIILYVVVCQQFVKLFELSLFFDINITPE